MSDLPYSHREVLNLMRLLRESVIRVRAKSALGEEAQALKDAIDRFAGRLTGDSEYFWSKSHSIGK